MRVPAGLWVILGCFLALAIAYASLTPYRTAGRVVFQNNAQALDIGAPDERQHANYIQHLRQGKGFPVLKPGDPNLYESYQAHQPPAYYLLGAAVSLLAGDPTESGTGLRLLSALLGLASLVGLFFCGRWGFESDELGLAAAAFGLMPMFVALNSAITNDALLYALCVWASALVLRALRRGWSARGAAGLGLVLALGLYTKTSALALLPMAFVALMFSRPRPKAAVWALALGLPVLLAAPWFARNQALYGDPLAMRAFREAFTGAMQAETLIERIGAVAYWTQGVGLWTAQSFVGTFGYMDIFLPVQVYGVAWLALVVGLVGWMLRLRSLPREERRTEAPIHWTLGALLGVVLLLFIQFNLTYFQGQARYLYPALPAFALGVGAGLTYLLRSARVPGWVALTGLCLVLNVASLGTIAQEFPRRIS